MRIGLLIHPCDPGAPGGLGRANFALAEALLNEKTEHSYVVYLKGDPKSTPFMKYPHATVVFMGNGPLWLMGAKSLDATLSAYVFFTPVIPLFFSPKQSVVIALDFAFLSIPAQAVRERIGTWFLYWIQRRSLKKATKVLSISEATRQDALKYFHLPPEKVETMHIGYMALSEDPTPISVPGKFFLFAGVFKERKNVTGIVRAFALFHKNNPEFHLVLAGKKEGAYYRTVETLTQYLGIADVVHFVGYVTNAELAFLYDNAIALVFPSLLEGFGMPILEAMDRGLPVITSNSGSLAEISGNAAFLVNPEQPVDIARGLQTLAEDQSLRTTLKTKGYARAAEFSWEKAAHILNGHLHALHKM